MPVKPESMTPEALEKIGRDLANEYYHFPTEKDILVVTAIFSRGMIYAMENMVEV